MRKTDIVALDTTVEATAATRCIRCFCGLEPPVGARATDLVRCPECGFSLTVGALRFFGEELAEPTVAAPFLFGDCHHAAHLVSDGPFSLYTH